MEISDSTVKLVKRFEGLRLKAYVCSSNVWTIGYGHTGPDVHPGLQISSARAEELLRIDLERFARVVNREFACVLLDQNQFDALVSFAFNVGERNLAQSTLSRKVKANPDDPTIRREFCRWVYSRGKISPGLQRRRLAEADVYFTFLNPRNQ